MISAYEHGRNAAKHAKHIQACPFDTGTGGVRLAPTARPAECPTAWSCRASRPGAPAVLAWDRAVGTREA
jgi:hypothetical protein